MCVDHLDKLSSLHLLRWGHVLAGAT